MVQTLADVALEWNSLYWAQKRLQGSSVMTLKKLYNEILDKLAVKYYQQFCYESTISFKRDVRVVKGNLSKGKKKHHLGYVKNTFPMLNVSNTTCCFKEEIVNKVEDLEFNDFKFKEELLDEGIGLLYTINEVLECDLNSDSYWF